MAPKKEEQTVLESLGFKTASDAIEAFKNRRVLFIEPVGLALMTDRIDPINGLPGLPMGSQVEIFGPPGKGKCFRLDTPILMYDGTIKPVQDVIPGDQVMGPDSKPRNVLSLGRGNETMYEVKPIKGEPFYCNESHILSLERSKTRHGRRYRKDGSVYIKPNPPYPGQDVVNVSVKDYLTWSNTKKSTYKLYRSGAIDFPRPEFLIIDPYMLGLWLGDGTKSKFHITTGDKEIEDYVFAYADAHNKRARVTEDKPGFNCLTVGILDNEVNHLKDLGVWMNKHIPHVYKTASVEARKELLAGLIDADGCENYGGYVIVQKIKRLAEDIAFVARSLGWAAYVKETTSHCYYKGEKRVGTYYKVGISGNNIDLPVKLKRRELQTRNQIKNPLHTGFSLTKLAPEDYYGFTVDGDSLFLLGDFTVVHNTAIADNFIKNIHLLDPTAKVALLCFEDWSPERMKCMAAQGLDLDRLYLLDYTNEALQDADTGLNTLLALAKSGEVVAVIIDSVGASAVSKEVYDKSGDLVGVDTNLAMCARANTYTKFANQWQTLNPLTRPVLIYINHYKDKVGQDDASMMQLKANQIGEDLNLPTPGGWGFKYNLNMRLKIDARKWPPPKASDEKHELYNYREQKGLEVFIKAPRNRFFPGFKEAHAILDFTNPHEVRFDIESEVISLCSMLDVEGIQETGNGRVKFPKMGEISYWKKDVVKWLKENPEYRWELIRKLAPLAQKAFKIGKEAPPKEKI